ncbi:MAG: ABC transporter ATP-binding protein [Candidatus Heimdallarchaeota archaeon]|nr:MAG: ABC transporter ATP-binding protein [Candidatus Heimdallarchaeota archaeon]
METILEAKNLTKKFPVQMGIFGARGGSYIHAVDNVNFTITKGETFGIVGESGCGKTTVAKLILRLLNPTEGTIWYYGKDIFQRRYPVAKMRRRIQLIFQDPYSSLNPRMTVYDIIGEPLDIHKLAKGSEKKERILQLMKTVGLANFHLYRYPHEFSGGQRQRVVIARALAVQPEVLIMDEPVSALDVSVRAQVLNLLEELQKRFDLTYIFISHDLSVVRHVCDRVGVMYLGQIVELGEVGTLFDNPQHPYAEALIAAVPIPDPRTKKTREILSGEVPTPIDPPLCCRFAMRCKYAQEICHQEEPPLLEIKPDHQVACFFPKELQGTGKVPFGKTS